MFGLFGGNDRPLLVATIKATVAIAVLSVLAAKYLADGSLDQPTLSRLAAEAAKGKGEPTMTGSINRVRIDPCTGPQKS
jgi:cytochrome c-type biogenesis protein CcmH/NrfG